MGFSVHLPACFNSINYPGSICMLDIAFTFWSIHMWHIYILGVISLASLFQNVRSSFCYYFWFGILKYCWFLATIVDFVTIVFSLGKFISKCALFLLLLLLIWHLKVYIFSAKANSFFIYFCFAPYRAIGLADGCSVSKQYDFLEFNWLLISALHFLSNKVH